MTGQRAPIFFFPQSSTCRIEECYLSFLMDEKWAQRETVMNFRSTLKNKSPLFSFFSSKLGYLLIHQPAPVLLKQRRGEMVGYSQGHGRATPLDSNGWSHFPIFPVSILTNLGGTCTEQRRGNEKKLCESQSTIVYFSLSYPYWRNRMWEKEKRNVHTTQSVYRN